MESLLLGPTMANVSGSESLLVSTDSKHLQEILELLESVDDSDALINSILSEEDDDKAVVPVEKLVEPVAPLCGVRRRPSAPKTRSIVRKPSKMSGSTRVRDEILKLRADAKEFENQLQLLRSRRAVPRMEGQSRAFVAPRDTPQGIQIWKNVAMRQYRARREAEVTNERLKATVDEQRKIAQQFMRSLHRGANLIEQKHGATITEAEAPGKPATSSSHLHGITDYDAGVQAHACEALMDCVDLMLIHADTVLNDPVFQTKEGVSKYSQVHDDGSISVSDTRDVPFDFNATSEAIWNYYAARTTEPTAFPHMEEVNENLMIKGFRMTLGSGPLQVGQVEGTIVGRRLVEQGRVIIVWAANVLPAAGASSGFLTSRMSEYLSFRATGWTFVIEDDDICTVKMKHCVRANNSNSMQGVMAQMVKRLVIQGMTEHQETVNRLVDDAFIGGHKTETTSSGFGLSSIGDLFMRSSFVALESW